MRKFRNGALGKNNLPVFASSTIIAVICLLLTSSSASAQRPVSPSSSSHESERAAQVRALNNSVLQLHGQMQENASGTAGVHSQAAIVLAQRAAALQTLIKQDPHTALTFAFSPELLADLAAKFPSSAAQLESHTTLSGPIEHWIFDGADMRTSRSQYQLKVGPQNLNLHFSGPEPDLAKGAVFQITGVVVGTEMAVSETRVVQTRIAAGFAAVTGSAILRSLSGFVYEYRWLGLVCLMALALLAALGFAVTVSQARLRVRQVTIYALVAATIFTSPAASFAQASTCSTIGAQNVAVLLVTFPNANLPAGVTTQSLQDVFFNTSTGTSLDGYLREASYGQTWATGGVFGPFTLAGSYTSCTDVGGAVLNDAVAAATAAGVNLNNYTRLVLIFPDVFNCGWQGFANVGSCTQVTSSGTFNLSVAYISAAYTTPRFSGVQLASHEIGHNLGLLHAGTVTPATPSDVLGPTSSVGTESDLGDNWSTMGQVELGLYPSQQKAEVLGWMAPASNYQVVQNSGTYTLQPLEINPPGLQALKVQRGGSANEWLWIEYRQPIGNYDSTLLSQPYSGALIHYEDPSAPTGHSYLPNFTPTDITGFSAALAVGRSWTDPYTNLTISVLSATSNGLAVSVTYGAAQCGTSAPGITVSPLNPSIYPGQIASYSATVTNNDGNGCASSTINLGSSEPSGWSTAFSSSSLTLSPGQSANVTLGKGSPVGTPAGTYAVNLVAASNSANSAGTANATVVTPPSLVVSLSLPAAAFSRPGTVPVSATVTSAGTVVSGASVKFTITTPTGGTATQMATTSSNGMATLSYKLNARSPVGGYTATAQAILSSGSKKAATTQSANSNTVAFTVQ